MEIKKKYALITGASSGIGRSLAVNLSAKYNLILHGRNEERLQETRALCRKEHEQLIFKHDLEKIEEIENAISTIVNDHNLEIVHFVHCAGFLKMLPFKMVTVDLIQATMATNFISAALIAKVLVQKKINDSALESIVFVSSNISNCGAKAFSVYAASKGALDSLMRCLAVELAPKVRVNSVLPGAIQTEMTKNMFENAEVIDRMVRTYPLGFGRVEDISPMVEFLLSEGARWITGQQFTVDGGRNINITG
jgi:NAD(P)-dependent dehydrogenase (short-subunit alcohol dehydrogenase family)